MKPETGGSEFRKNPTSNVQRPTFNADVRKIRKTAFFHSGFRFRVSAFTLVELLLVMAIVGVMAAVTMPSFVRSMKGNRLRAAARVVVMAGRYAHSMCLLNQKELDIQFDLANGTIAVVAAMIAPVEGGVAPALPATGQEAVAASAGTAGVEVFRKLDEVRIASVEIEDADEGSLHASDKRVRVVHYRSNGTCTPYRVRIVDDDGGAVTVNVDMLASVETERD